MRKLCAIIILSIFITNSKSFPQKIWSRPVRNPQGQLIRERRQFPFGDWIPLNQQCPTCRPVADTSDVGFKGDSIGLTPPRPPITRQIHGEGNFFAQDESSILSVPPPPPSAIPRHPITNPNTNFQFSNFAQQFNSPLPGPTQQIFPQTQQIPFLAQTFLQNQQLSGNNNQQILSSLNSQNNAFGQENQNKEQISNGKLPKFNTEFKTQKLPENVVLEQNKRPQPFFNKPTPFSLPQHQPQQQQQQQFGIQQPQKQSFVFQQQQQNGIKIDDSILTPPPAPTNISQDVIIPGLNKEEIQLLYVPVETLRQRGNFQQQQLLSQQNIQFNNRPTPSPLSPSTFRPTEPSPTKVPKGHFVTQNDITQGSLSTFKVTPSKPFSTAVTPSSLLFQQLPFQQTPQPFVSATPVTPTTPNFVTLSSASQKFSPFTPETSLSHLVTVSDNLQLDFGFSTTPKTNTNQEVLSNQFVNGKTQFTDFKENSFPQQKQEILQSFGNQQVIGQPQQGLTVFQNQQKQIEIQNQQINQQPILLKEQQKLLEEEKKLQEQILLKQQQEKEIEAQRLLQQQKEKEIETQRLLQQQREKELEEQRLLLLKKEKELEEQKLAQEQLVQQRFLQQQKQKELEQQRREKELEEQRLLQQQRQKELEEQRYLQQQNQKKLEQQRFLQQQQEKELENQRRLQLQRQRDLEEKRRLQALKQKEEEQRLYRLQQQQQRELEEKRLYKQQQEEQQRLLLERQKQENVKKQTQIPFYQQQVNQQQFTTQQGNRHKLPANDHLNSISQLEKESEPEGSQLVPHQPPLSVFYKGQEGAEARITDVLKELRSSNRITVLDQYFEKMPKVFVGPAGLNPPVGYGKFELPYLSNIENNRIERKIERLPFFVAPLNFVPPPGYAKIPFPAPHVGSVVVSSESNPAMKFQREEKENNEGFSEGNGSESFSMVGPELPGLINNLETETTTLKSVTFSSTPSLPQTTAQLRNRRPNANLYKTQTRKPIARTRYQITTIKPAEEEEVTQPIQKVELSKDTDAGLRKPFNRFLNRRRQQANAVKNQQEDKTLENRHYSVEVYHQQKNTNSLPKNQINTVESQKLNVQSEIGSIDRSTPGDLVVDRVSSTPGFLETGSSVEVEGSKSDLSSYSDVSLQSFEDGPLPTGSAKTITQELYRPNVLQNNKEQPKQETVHNSEKVQYSSFEDEQPSKYPKISEVNPTSPFSSTTSQETGVSEHIKVPLTGFEQPNTPQETSEKYYVTEQYKTEYTPTSITVSLQEPTKGIEESDVQFTSAFADISKHHHFPVPSAIPKDKQSSYQNPRPTPDTNFHTTYSQEQVSQEFLISGNDKTQFAEYENNKFAPNITSEEKTLSEFHRAFSNVHGVQGSEKSTSQIIPTAPAAVQDQYTTGFSVISGFSENLPKLEEERRPSFIGFRDISTPSEVSPTSSPQPEYYSSSTLLPQDQVETTKYNNQVKTLERNHDSVTEEPKLDENPSTPAFKVVSKDAVQINDEKHTTEGQEDNLPGSHRLKLQNPSIVRVRTRGRGKPRGQINFASSQSTTQAPIIRHKVENKITEHADQESTTKINVQDYQSIRTSKYNTYRGVKKPIRTTTEPSVTTEQKVNIYTIRPQKRPLNPSTVSTKRIRRPTTPLSTLETATESFGISTAAPYYHQTDNGELSPSGFSNDVYYEHSSLAPVRQKFRKHFGSAEQKNDVISVQTSTPLVPTPQVQTSSEFTQEFQHFPQTPVPIQQHSETYPEWNPSESGIDVSGILLTTVKTTSIEEEEVEEPKKTPDNKKAFDPDLEKKSGRRRVRVRVHKRPHENFETAESQNLRTVANVLVPPTSTYKPSDETNFHQLAKNSDSSLGGNKNYGVRSREYFRKRLNLTQIDSTENKEGQIKTVSAGDDAGEKSTKTKVLSFVRKIPHKTNDEIIPSQTSEISEDDGSKIHRSKHRGYVRKIIKHKGGSKIVQTESIQSADNEETNEKKSEFSSRQNFKENIEDPSLASKFNGTRHRTIIRYVKKNKHKPHETESEVERTGSGVQTDEQKLKNFTEPAKQEQVDGKVLTTVKQTFDFETQFSTESLPPAIQNTEEYKSKQNEEYETQNSNMANFEALEKIENEEKETTESLVRTTQEPIVEEENQNLVTGSDVNESESETSQAPQTQEPKIFRNSFSIFRLHSSKSPETVTSQVPSTQDQGLVATQKNIFNQNLRPVFQRPPYTGFQRSRNSTTERVKEIQEKRDGPLRSKYGKTSSYSTTEAEAEAEEVQQRINNFQTEQQIKNKNLHTLEVRKYLRTKSKEGAFSSFSKNRYYTSGKSETATTRKENTDINEPEENTTPFEDSLSVKKIETTASESKSETTQSFIATTATTEGEGETTKLDEELFTTEEILHSSEENSTEQNKSESEDESEEESKEESDEISSTVESTTESKTELPNTVFYTVRSESVETSTKPKTAEETISQKHLETQPDLYRFSKSSFSFDEAEKFTGTKNRAHVRNITADIIENTASFSAPGVEKKIVPLNNGEELTKTTEFDSGVTRIAKTDEPTTEQNTVETTTEYPDKSGTETVTAIEPVTKPKVTKLIKTSTQTKISHETEICYKGKCIRTKSENPDEDLKLLVDSATTAKLHSS